MKTKDRVLEILTGSKGSPVSGEKLAEECSVSRAAIWKAVNSLRSAGFVIEGTTNGGYAIKESGDIFSKELLSSYFKTNFQSFKDSRIEVYSEIDSTNTQARRELTEAGALRDENGELTEAGKKHHKSFIVAEKQTAGRGRLGRTFVSPAKTGIYLTIIYAPKGGITDPAKLTAFAAVAVCRAVKKLCNTQPKIKWINDIFAGGKKICGILTEGFANFETGRIDSAYVGIGINIKDNPEVFKGDVAKVAGSILSSAEKSRESPKRHEIAAEVAGQFLTLMESEPEKIISEYKENSFLIGQTIEVHPVIGDEKKIYKAKAVDIDDDAGLVVELSDGTRKTLRSGEVTLKSYQFV